ncbi:hypothetical protein GZ77_04405 [Endozoicomonas montiporae]|uniref:Paraquat-inducible protein A n=2 Tax=Endozoicomonas montiporae TaxID=1027273 RepID=A0A081NBG1_9GAMM|nr:paraquat-inducible protein A [Endozoicomonas montiporae]AMO56067.1 paraquat-inducible protein A [Endozoicomonas montiporae CL-33]KEQ15784.1 hypothetical protein GZ77_04405 [Endozoicomonas montiporae]
MTTNTRTKRLAPLIILIISLALLIPGITQPLITLQASLSHQAMVETGQTLVEQQDMHPAMKSMASQFLGSLKVSGDSLVYDKTRSILGTAEDLWQFGYRFVAVLILLFSVVIPAIKSILLTLACLSSSSTRLLKANALLSKWSMSDVFAMGVIIALLAANAASSETAAVNFNAQLHSGFYWFVAYCLLSTVGSQLLIRKD